VPTIAPSTIPAAKSALVQIITTLVNDSNVMVTYGYPTGEPQREWIMVADVAGQQESAAIGSRHREETYTIDVVVSVLEEAGDNQTSTERAFALAALIEVGLRFTYTNLNGSVRTALVAGPIALRELKRGAKVESQLTISIACTARI
jgi:hypothetical protein